jgi:tetratricopeptide (TPR) repeat protein
MNQGPPQALTAGQASRLNQGFRLLQQGKADEALSIALNITKQVPRSPDARHFLALCHKAKGNLPDALEAFQQAVALGPGNPHIRGNYANLLKSLGRIEEALLSYRRAVEASPAFVQGWINLGLAALDTRKTAEALAAFERAVALEPRSGSAWQGLGNAKRASGDLQGAEHAFRKAVELAPDRGPAWVNLGVVVRLLGRPAEALPLLERARKAGFTGPELLDAESGARIDLGEIEEALAVTRRLTKTAPWYAPGHEMLAHLLWEHEDFLSDGEDPLAAFRQAVDEQPGNKPVQLAFLRFLADAKRADEALERVRILRGTDSSPALAIFEANLLDTLGQTQASAPIYEQLYEQGVREASFLNAYTRHLLRTGRWDAAAARAEEAARLDRNNQEAWGYLGTAWRLLGDPREYWLNDYDRAIALVEVEPPTQFASQDDFTAALAATLDRLHKARREPVNQSLRGGSQTQGRLFGRPDPVIVDTQASITRAVERHIATLPDDPGHPFFGRKGRSINFVGSWSVKLWSSGRHVNHFHPQGWMSSAYYVSLPPSVARSAGGQSGWIQFGQPPEELNLELEPRRLIQPEAGHVALFPSYMWHGTVPFEDAEPRLTVAFDMLPVP